MLSWLTGGAGGDAAMGEANGSGAEAVPVVSNGPKIGEHSYDYDLIVRAGQGCARLLVSAAGGRASRT